MFDFKNKLACHYQGTVNMLVTVENVEMQHADLQDLVDFKAKLQAGLAAAAGYGTESHNIILDSFTPQDGKVSASVTIVVPDGGTKVSAKVLNSYFSLGADDKAAKVEANKKVVAVIMQTKDIKKHSKGVVSVSWDKVTYQDAFKSMDDMRPAELPHEEHDTLQCHASFPQGCKVDWSGFMKQHCCNFQNLCCEGYEAPQAEEIPGSDNKLSRSEFTSGLAVLQQRCHLTPAQEEYVWKGLSPDDDGYVTREAWATHMDVCKHFYHPENCTIPGEKHTTLTTTQPSTTAKEATRTLPPIPQKWKKEAAEFCEEKLDLTGDKEIDEDEIMVAVAKALSIGEADISGEDKAVFKLMDHTGDGKVSLDECIYALTRWRQVEEAMSKDIHGPFTVREFGQMSLAIAKKDAGADGKKAEDKKAAMLEARNWPAWQRAVKQAKAEDSAWKDKNAPVDEKTTTAATSAAKAKPAKPQEVKPKAKPAKPQEVKPKAAVPEEVKKPKAVEPKVAKQRRLQGENFVV